MAYFKNADDEREWLYEQNKVRKITQKELAGLTKQSQATISKKIREEEIYRQAKREGKEEAQDRILGMMERVSKKSTQNITSSGSLIDVSSEL